MMTKKTSFIVFLCISCLAWSALVSCPLPHAPFSGAEPLWVTDNAVNTLAKLGHTLYLGGLFQYVGPPTGGGSPVNQVSGATAAGSLCF